MALPEDIPERGIIGAHGFMSEYFTTNEEYLVNVADNFAEYAYLAERLSIIEKALELSSAVRTTFTWNPRTVLILGDGSLGLLAVARLSSCENVYCLGQQRSPDDRIKTVEKFGAT